MAKFTGFRPRYHEPKLPGFTESFAAAAGEGLGKLPFQLATDVGGSYLKDLILPTERQQRDIAGGKEGRDVAAAARQKAIDDRMQPKPELPGPAPEGSRQDIGQSMDLVTPPPRPRIPGVAGRVEPPIRGAYGEARPGRRGGEAAPAVAAGGGLILREMTTGAAPTETWGLPEPKKEWPPAPPPRYRPLDEQLQIERVRHPLKPARGPGAPKPITIQEASAIGTALDSPEATRAAFEGALGGQTKPEVGRVIGERQKGRDAVMHLPSVRNLPTGSAPAPILSPRGTGVRTGRETTLENTGERLDQQQQALDARIESARLKMSDSDKAFVRSKDAEASALEREAASFKTAAGKVTPEGAAKLKRAKILRATTQDYILSRAPQQ